jgi:hypothetical protein
MWTPLLLELLELLELLALLELLELLALLELTMVIHPLSCMCILNIYNQFYEDVIF